MNTRPPREEDLLRFVDGTLPADDAAALARALAADPALAARVEADRAVAAALNAAFAPVLDEDVPPRLLAAARPHRARARHWLRAAAAVVLLTIGAAGGWFARDVLPLPNALPEPALPRVAANAHRVFAVEVRHPVEVGADEEAHLVQWLSRRMGSALRVPRLDTAGYQLVGGRLLAGARGPAAQFMYQTTAGQRLTLYVATNPNNRETAFRFAEENGSSVFYWYDGPLGYALSGDVARAQLLPLARAVYEQIAN